MEEEAQSRPSSLAKDPSSRKPSRRVAFDMSSRPPVSTLSDFQSSIDHLDKGRYHPRCFACCAWSCFGFLIFLIVFLFLGITYLAFLKSGMPQVYVRAFNVTKLQIDNGSQKMDAVIDLGMLFINNNEKLKLFYGPLSVDVTSYDVLLGKTKLEGLYQMPMNETKLDMTMKMENEAVNKYAADELKSDMKALEMVFDVYVGGHIGYQVGSWDMDNVPFLASCRQVKKMDVDFGRKAECDVKMFSTRPSSN